MKSRCLFMLKTTKQFVTVAFLFMSLTLTAQDTKPSDLKDFKIIIENTVDGLKLQGIEGSVWTDLSFTINTNQSQAINTYGMTKVNDIMEEVDDTYTHFLITVTKTANGIKLKGVEGTAWKEASATFSFKSEKVMLDQHGIKNIY